MRRPRAKYIKVNAAQCVHCKEILISWYRHDFKECSCGKGMVDGGFDYVRRWVGMRDLPLYWKREPKPDANKETSKTKQTK